MDPRIKRILVYMVVAVTLFAIATFFTESRAAFVAVFAVGMLISLAADLMFLTHLFRLPWNRRTPP